MSQRAALCASTYMLLLTGCATSVQPSPTSSEVVYTGASEHNIAKITVTAVNQLRWQDIKRDLAAAKTVLAQDQLLKGAFTVTSSNAQGSMDRGSSSLSATLLGAAVNKQESTSIDTQGLATQKVLNTTTLATPQVPTALTSANAAGISAAASAGFLPDVDAATRVRLEAALAASIVELNRRYDGLPIQPGYVPIFVDLQVSIDPLNRYQPYDTTLTLDFCHNPRENDKLSKFACASGKKIFAIPLDSTEIIEGSQANVARDTARQIALQIGAASHGVGINAATSRLLEDLIQQQYLEQNTLSLPVQNGSTGILVRFGANRVGSRYEMAARTHSITLILLVPREDTYNGSDNFEIAVKAQAFYRDPAVPEDAPIGDTRRKSEVLISVFPIDPVPRPGCPDVQDLAAQVVAATALSPATMSLVLNGVDGLDYRRVKAYLTTPQLKDGRAATLVSSATIPAPDGLHLSFPDISGLLKPGVQETVVRGSLRLFSEGGREEQPLSCPMSGSAYSVLFPLTAAKKEGAEKAAKAAVPVPKWILSEAPAAAAKS